MFDAVTALPDSPHYQAVLSSLFQLSAPPVRGFVYDSDLPDSSSLKGHVVERFDKDFHVARCQKCRGSVAHAEDKRREAR